jgi:sulfur-oxidizing protein SoxB
MNRREFLQVLAAAAGAGLPLKGRAPQAATDWSGLYEAPTFGNVHFLHLTDAHAQLNPIHFREPSVNLGLGAARNRPPHLVGAHLLKSFGLKPGTAEAYAFTCLDFESAATRYGKVGGFAHWLPWSSRCAHLGPVRCCSMVAIPGRAPPPRSGPTARTWWMPRWRWAWM